MNPPSTDPSRYLRLCVVSLAAILGAGYALFMGPLRVPDEGGHLYRAVALASGACRAAPAVGAAVDWRELDRYPVWAPLPPGTTAADMLRMIDTNGGTLPLSLVNAHIFINMYSCVTYLPAAAGIRAARFATDSPLYLLYAGRLANLAAFLVALYWALRLLPDFHLSLACLALMPMTLHQAASLSADAVTIWTAFLSCAYVLRLATGSRVLGRKEYIALAIGSAVLALSKSNATLLLLPVMIPESKFASRKARWMVVAGCLAMGGAAAGLWQLANRQNVQILSVIAGYGSYSVSEKAHFVLQHPVLLVGAIGRTVADSCIDFAQQFVGKLGFQTISLPAWIVWSCLGSLAIVAVTQSCSVRLHAWQRLTLLGVFLASGAAIFIYDWIVWPAGDFLTHEVIEGRGVIVAVVGRYFIPLAFLVLAALSSYRLRFPRVYVAVPILALFILANAVALARVWEAYQRRTSLLPNRLRMAARLVLTGPKAAALLYDHRLVQNPDRGTPVYFVSDGVRHVVSGDWMKLHGYRWPDDVLIVRGDAPENIPMGGSLKPAGPSAVGVFREGHRFILDANGNHRLDGTAPGQDRIIESFVPTQPGDIPLTGDWDGSGKTKIGIYRPAASKWFLDLNGNGVFDSADRTYTFGGSPLDIPVVGDWNGTGTDKIGVFRGGSWLLDYNGNGSVDAANRSFTFGGPGDVPVVGDWNKSGISKVGVFRAGYLWVLDTNGNYVLDAGDRVFPFGGVPGDIPVAGDWNGDGRTKVGIFRSGFLRVLDTNGSQSYTPGISQTFAFGGIGADKPIVGKW